MTKNLPFFNQILLLEQRLVSLISQGDFCANAAMALKDFDFGTFEGMKTLREALPLTKSVSQYYSPNGFGKCNLTLVNNGHFCVLVMFMDDISTEIHDHGFEGVFAPLQGSPLQLTFGFTSEGQITDHLETGKLVCQGYQTLGPGELLTIQRSLIHMLERPVSNQFSLLVCRPLPTHERHNHFYLYPGLRIKNRASGSYLSRFISMINVGSNTKISELEHLVSSLEKDELIQLFFRIGPELADRSMERDEIRFVRELARRELEATDLWEIVSGHVEYLQLTKAKASILAR